MNPLSSRRYTQLVDSLNQRNRAMHDIEQCPKCGDDMQRPRVAISRRDNKTAICPDCGVREAMADTMKSIRKEKENGPN